MFQPEVNFYALIDAASLYPGGGVPGLMAKNGMGPTLGHVTECHFCGLSMINVCF